MSAYDRLVLFVQSAGGEGIDWEDVAEILTTVDQLQAQIKAASEAADAFRDECDGRDCIETECNECGQLHIRHADNCPGPTDKTKED